MESEIKLVITYSLKLMAFSDYRKRFCYFIRYDLQSAVQVLDFWALLIGSAGLLAYFQSATNILSFLIFSPQVLLITLLAIFGLGIFLSSPLCKAQGFQMCNPDFYPVVVFWDTVYKTVTVIKTIKEVSIRRCFYADDKVSFEALRFMQVGLLSKTEAQFTG